MRAALAVSISLVLAVGCRRAADVETDPGDALPAPAIVPRPAWVEPAAGSFTLDADTTISATPGAEAAAELLAAALRPGTGLPLEVVAGEGGGIALILDPELDLPAEGYLLDATSSGVTVSAADAAGLFYGAQTLRQLLPAEAFASAPAAGVAWEIPAVYVEDAPRLEWRGLMIDVARHFFTVEEVERQIDLMALHKLNRLHLHLTDDQGWRIEIKSWPALAEIGGSTEVGGGPGGWYTQEEYAEIVAYAAERHVVVVPEIDLPGHAHAALASYGELNPDGIPLDPYTGAGVISTPIWLDGPATHGFVEDVWAEVAAITPGPWVHIGGDEAVSIADEDYRAFILWLQGVITAEGKTMIGWDEIGETPLEPPYAAQHWIDQDRAVGAVRDQGARLISSPAGHAYLDMAHDTTASFGQVWAGRIDVERAYSWNPVPRALEASDVLGLEGALWTEFIDSTERMDLMLWPRAAALAEVGWTPPEDQVWDDFSARMKPHGQRLDGLGVGYYRSREIDWE